eukprot:TRINITY_DN6078_c1_g1_i1.p1 TRINITY_DN6078_c1_g1~~TRINITY_DN6078_c1_g1_i1.p1  ORF type:complete len:549 (+),score=118.20 TRINITY_DN6078_c1_g1_i1:74-1648(+)
MAAKLRQEPPGLVADPASWRAAIARRPLPPLRAPRSRSPLAGQPRVRPLAHREEVKSGIITVSIDADLADESPRKDCSSPSAPETKPKAAAAIKKPPSPPARSIDLTAAAVVPAEMAVLAGLDGDCDEPGVVEEEVKGASPGAGPDLAGMTVQNGQKMLVDLATTLAQENNGSFCMLMLVLHSEVVDYGRDVMSKEGKRVALRKLLEDAIASVEPKSNLKVEDGAPFPMVVLKDFKQPAAKVLKLTERHSPEIKRKNSPRASSQLALERKRFKEDKNPGWGSWSAGDQWDDDGWSSWRETWDHQSRAGEGRGEDGGGDHVDGHLAGAEDGWERTSRGKLVKQRLQRERPSNLRGGGGERGTMVSAGTPQLQDHADGREAAVDVEGVHVEVIFNVPVVSIDKGSDFDSFAAWILQLALDDHGKAESLYEECSHAPQGKKVVQECLRRGIADAKQDVGVIRQKSNVFPPALGAGLQGKRSLMLAVAIALCCKHEVCFDRCMRELRTMQLHERFRRLISECERHMNL